ncbi:MAG: histidine kinase [Desulfobacterales bacterium]|nr:histidine kinase [Desulfobacterales bacterium]
MLDTPTILLCSFGYMGFLFALAYWGRKRADTGRSVVANPYIYALSLAVYCTAWTFYGSVGRAAHNGLGFLPTYIGPTLMAAMGWLVLRKIIRISKIHHITSIADFIASRYGKSSMLGGVVAIIAVLGVVPYISLQLKAISTTFSLISQYPRITMAAHFGSIPFYKDTAFYVAMMLAAFSILFGTRHLDATERHEGLVTAIAFESIVKLAAFIVVGAFVTWGIYDGIGDLFQRAGAMPQIRELFTMPDGPNAYGNWAINIFLSMMAVLFLPRQFQVAVVENVNEEHLNKAIWLFPVYLLAINIFVLPIAFGGLLHFPEGGVDADFLALTLPMAMKHQGLALFVFIGGMSAATGMVIVETVALSTMICNQLVTPVLLRLPISSLQHASDLSHMFLTIRRVGILLVLLLGYAHFHFIGEFYALVSIGLVSFAAVTQFAPAILGGIFWKEGARLGALSGLVVGFLVWFYTLVLPSLVQAGFISKSFVTHGPFGIEMLKPFELFGLQGFDHISHSVFWSMLANVSVYVGVSLFTRPTAFEHTQATLFVDVYKYSGGSDASSIMGGTASVPDLKFLLERFLGRSRAEEALAVYAREHNVDWDRNLTADAGLVYYAEQLLAGSIGSSSAHVVVSSVVEEQPLDIGAVMNILDETRQVITYSHELEKATTELQAANEQLKELDRLKDEFISTVTHELRTPLTSVRALAEILHDNPDIDEEKHRQFCGIIIRESERLTRLITQVLDFQKMEAGRMTWEMSRVDLNQIIRDAVAATRQLIDDKRIELKLDLSYKAPSFTGDRDKLTQVMVNIISNAVKFCPDDGGIIAIELKASKNNVLVNVKDNGVGISRKDREAIFEQFTQVKDATRGRPAGSGLGLTITRRIIEFHQGKIWVKSKPGKGAVFSFTLPMEKIKPPKRVLSSRGPLPITNLRV